MRILSGTVFVLPEPPVKNAREPSEVDSITLPIPEIELPLLPPWNAIPVTVFTVLLWFLRLNPANVLFQNVVLLSAVA